MRRLLVLLALVVLMAPWSAHAAGWSVVATTQTPVHAHTVVPPTSVSCQTSLLQLTLAWDDVDPRYDYRVEVRRVDTGLLSVSRSINGSATSVTLTGLDALGLSVGLGVVDLRVSVTSYLAASPTWESSQRAYAGRVLVDTRVLSLGLTC